MEFGVDESIASRLRRNYTTEFLNQKLKDFETPRSNDHMDSLKAFKDVTDQFNVIGIDSKPRTPSHSHGITSRNKRFGWRYYQNVFLRNTKG